MYHPSVINNLLNFIFFFISTIIIEEFIFSLTLQNPFFYYFVLKLSECSLVYTIVFLRVYKPLCL